ncbi:enoyl-CoA hydratase [Mycobacterium sp. 236(2023)]|uniref:enoyl-CoA hydratase n=1 Tax=Mycobacterium sp. 236(2023) TaxID=3038163 RepID=UPI0024152266|nr:enoyl-CoA hydratase [Mycobacterium sp. 236(2023)]MDG4667886.1 enoyl-CoA hydratase [Mycobacterium sp. 236(2023)]
MTVETTLSHTGTVLTVRFNRPEQRNAMTFSMYRQLEDACRRANADNNIRLVVLRGTGGRAFVAGTDIGQFENFDAHRGVDYERRIDAAIRTLLAVDVPVVALIEGFCVGAGLLIALASDLRLATTDASFGFPIARTLGNTVSVQSLALTTRQLGHARTVDMLMTSRLLGAQELRAAGFLSSVADEIDDAAERLVERLLANAPLTMWSVKETLRRITASVQGVDADDVIAKVYGSTDFAIGAAAFHGKATPRWTGA